MVTLYLLIDSRPITGYTWKKYSPYMGYYVKYGKSKNRKYDIIVTAANIKDYLKMAIDLECSLYTQKRMIASLDRKSVV